MAEKKNIPEIRFKGFNDDWEERKYSETFTKIPNNTLSRDELNYNSGLAKNVHYGDVLIKFGELLDVEKDQIPYITNDTLVYKIRSSKLQLGDVIIADTAEDETVGKCTELVNLGNDTIFSGLHTIPSRPTLPFASGYLGYFMNSPAYHTQLLRLMQGTKVSSISKAALQDTAIVYPIDSVEQSQIGTFFNHLDTLITLNQQKYNKLVTVKKAMLEKMFPQNGAIVPEIRFKGFTEAWEERKLKEMTDYKNGKGHEDRQVTAGKYELINLNSISIDGGLKLSGKFIDETDTTLNTNDLVMVLSDVGHGDLLGRVALIPENDRFVLNQRVALLRPNQSINPFFLFHNINAHQNYFKMQGAGMSQLNISKSSVEDFTSLVPTLEEEQSKIGKYFKNLDNLITLQQRELEKLKNIKKGCLEKMFV